MEKKTEPAPNKKSPPKKAKPKTPAEIKKQPTGGSVEKKTKAAQTKKTPPKKAKQKAPAELKKQPISPQEIWLVTANLNLSGLGYFLAGQKKRWLYFLGGGLALLLAAYFSGASKSPTLWMLVFLVFFIAMAVDLWLLQKKTPAILPKFLQKSTVLLPIASLLVNAIFYGGFFFYRSAGSNLYLEGLQAYKQSDFYTAFGNWYNLTNYYDLSLNPQVIDAKEPLSEVSLILNINNQVAAGEYSAAFASIVKFHQHYPNSSKTSVLDNTKFDAYLGLAQDLASQHDYIGSMEKLREGRSHFPDEAQARQGDIDAAYTAHYLAWGQYLFEQKDYGTALQKFEFITTGYSRSTEYQDAYEGAAQAYLAWVQQLDSEKSYESAALNLEKIINSYSKSSAVGEAEQQLPDAYLDWGKDLREQQHYLLAMQKFEEIKDLTGSASTVASAEKEYDSTIMLLAEDTGEDGDQVREEARKIACEEEIPTHPAIGLLKDEPGKMLACGSSTSWIPKSLLSTMPGNFQFIAFRSTDTRTIQTCPYTGGNTLYRKRKYYEIKVYKVATGELVAEKSFAGPNPDYCPYQHYFTSSTDSIIGDYPDKEPIAEWLEGVIE